MTTIIGIYDCMGKFKGIPSDEEYSDRLVEEDKALAGIFERFHLRKRNDHILVASVGALEMFFNEEDPVTATQLVSGRKINRDHWVCRLFTVTGDEERVRPVVERLRTYCSKNGYTQQNWDYEL
mgnify:CR=1 FL=1